MQIAETWPGVCPGVGTATMSPSSLSARQFRVVDQHAGGHVNGPVHVVSVRVGENDLRDVAEREARRGHCAGQLLLGADVHPSERNVART
jgi:hypothetical protein